MQDFSHKKKAYREVYRYTLLLDEVSICAAFFSAIIIRYNAIMRWADRKNGIYISMLITALLFEIIVYSIFGRREINVINMDPIDNLVSVCKNRFILSFMAITYFYITQRSVLTSRIVMGIFFCLSVLYGYVFRMVYSILYRKNKGNLGELNVYQLELPVLNIDQKIDEIKSGNYECVLVFSNQEDQNDTNKVLRKLEKSDIRSFVALDFKGKWIRSGSTVELQKFIAVSAFLRHDRYELFGVRYCIGKTEEAVRHVLDHLDKLKGKYICFSNVHTSVMARDNKNYARILNEASFVFPDGEPIANLERRFGYWDAERIAGPDFMELMFRNTTDGSVTHYFYGSSEKTLSLLEKNLREKYPGIIIKGMYSPPFRELTPEEDKADVERINQSGADIIWIGLGAPKQEKWMNAHKGKVKGIMLGVGAGFDFHAGTIGRAPLWMQKIGLEWFYRLITDPKRLFRRYIVTNIKFVAYVLSGDK